MEYSIHIGDFAEQLLKIYNSARPDYLAESCKIDFSIIPVLKIKNGSPKHDIDLEDCKLRFKFMLTDKACPSKPVFEINLDVKADTQITLIDDKGQTVAFKDCVKSSSLEINQFVKEKEFIFYGNPANLNVNLSNENSDIKYSQILNKAFNKCVEKINGTSK